MAMLPSEMPSDELDRRIVLLDKKIRKYERRRKEQLRSYFKQLAIMLIVIALFCAVIYLLVGKPYLTEENTVEITGRCVSVEFHSRKSIRHGSRSSNSFVMDDGKTYTADRRDLKTDTSEMKEAMIGEEITIRTMPDSYKIVALSDKTRVYFSLDDTNRNNKVDFVIAFSMVGVFSALIVLICFRCSFPFGEISDVHRSRKERKVLLLEKESRNRQE